MSKITKKIKISINHKEYEVNEGDSILEVCRENEIPVAALCRHFDFQESEALCRLCLVKAGLSGEKGQRLLPSCVLKAAPEMAVVTEDSDIIRVRKTILELLFMEHAGLCVACYRNLNCELQSLAIKYSIDQFRFLPKVTEMESEEALERIRDRLGRKIIDVGNASITRESSKCVECRRCIKACSEMQGIRALGVQKRGIQMGIGTEHYTPLECTYCGQCVAHCPTAAIIEKSDMVAVVKAIKNPNKMLIAQVAPSVGFTLGEEFGMAPGTVATGKMVAALRKCGFDSVFNLSTGADIVVLEEAAELTDRLQKENQKNSLPMFTSHCPAWVLYCEQYYPSLIPHLSSTRSPHMVMGSIIKNYYARRIKADPKSIVVVSVMPCTASKYEAARPEFSHSGLRDTDYVITVRELAHIIKSLNIPFADLANEDFDSALGIKANPETVSGITGRLAELVTQAASQSSVGINFPQIELREDRDNKGIKEGSVSIAGKNIRFALVEGFVAAQKVANAVVKGESPYQFIEVMSCPGGCVGGGGQPQPTNKQIRVARKRSIYASGKNPVPKDAGKNPVVKKIYREYFYKPGSRKAEKILHSKHYPFDFKLREKHMKRLGS